MSDKITLQELVESFARKCQLDPAEAALFVKEFLNLIEEALARDKYVKVKGLGTFKLINIEARKSVDVNTGESIEIKEHTRVSFVPETGLRDLINKPFAHFQSVLLNDDVHFEDLPDEGSVSEVNEEGEEISEAISDDEKDGLPETEEVLSETETGIATAVLVEEEQKNEVVEDAEQVIVVQENALSDEITASTEAGTEIKEPAEGKNEQKDFVSVPSLPMEEKKNIPWCMIASILLAGIFIGGIVTWVLTSGRRYIPEQVVEKLMNETQKTPAPVVPDSLQVADTVVVKKDSSLMQKKDTLKTAAKKEEKTPVVSTPVPKRETLADTVEYQITGNQGSYTLKPGESLVRVALKFYGNKKLWPYLVKHNKAIIKNPDNVPVGTTIQIPQLTPKK